MRHSQAESHNKPVNDSMTLVYVFQTHTLSCCTTFGTQWECDAALFLNHVLSQSVSFLRHNQVPKPITLDAALHLVPNRSVTQHRL